MTEHRNNVAASSTSPILLLHKNVHDGHKTKVPLSLKVPKLKVYKNNEKIENLETGASSATPLKIVNINQGDDIWGE